MSAATPPIGEITKPLFEATELLDFDFPLLPTPPISNNAGTESIPDDDGDGDLDLEAELAMMEAEEEERRTPDSLSLPRSYRASSSRPVETPQPVASCMSCSDG